MQVDSNHSCWFVTCSFPALCNFMLIVNFPQWAYITFIIRNIKKSKRPQKIKWSHKHRMRDCWLSNTAVKKGSGVSLTTNSAWVDGIMWFLISAQSILSDNPPAPSMGKAKGSRNRLLWAQLRVTQFRSIPCLIGFETPTMCEIGMLITAPVYWALTLCQTSS